MKKNNLLYLLILIALSSCSTKKDDGWVNLFNGKDFDGWRQLNGRARYEVVDGTIVGTTVEDTPNSFLTTEKTYSDFILELDLLLEERMNSGIQFRSLSKPSYKQGRVHGYQCEVDPSSRKWSGGIYDEARRGWLYPLTLNPEAGNAFKLDDWNRYRIECIGNTIRTWVNGVPAAHLIDDKTSEGFIALQIHSVRAGGGGKHIRWKNIRIKTEKLKPSPPDSIYVMNMIGGDLSEAEKALDWEWLWDGQTTKELNDFSKNRWQSGDGILSIKETAIGNSFELSDVVFNNPFSAFHLQWKYMLTPGATSGLKYLSKKGEQSSDYSGFEYQLQDNDLPPDTVQNHTLGSLYGLKEAKIRDRYINPPGEWNIAGITVSANQVVQHWLNGMKVLEYSLIDDEIRSISTTNNLIGDIVLKDEGHVVFFRDFKIKRLH